MPFRRIIFLLGLVVCGLVTTTLPARAQIHWETINAEYTFGGEITFTARLQGDTTPAQMLVFMQVEGEPATRSAAASLETPGESVLVYDLSQQPVRAFSTITYWLEAVTVSGETLTSPRQELLYDDNRFNWQVREEPPFRVHWYEGDPAFAQSMLDVARLGMQRVQGLFPVLEPELVDIYAYASAVEMQATLLLSGQNWVAGHADPDLGVMVVSLPPGPEQRLEMERQIPHELAHILLYRHMGPAYVNLPAWFSEGLASITELYPNPDYDKLLNIYYEQDGLFATAELCRSFPNDASGALLSYAQATSFTRYLQQQYGTSGLQKLIDQYRDGVECSRGVEVALGQSLREVEGDWRQEKFGANTVEAAAGDLAPWVILLVAVLAVPLGLVIGGLRKRGGSYDRNPIADNTFRPAARRR